MSQPTNPLKPSVCRRLFSDDSSEEPSPLVGADTADEQNILNRHMEQMEAERQRARERWNFDFESETPEEGVWEWERVEPEPRQQRSMQEEFETGNVQSEREGGNHSL